MSSNSSIRKDKPQQGLVTSSSAICLTDASTATEVTHLLRNKFDLASSQQENNIKHNNINKRAKSLSFVGYALFLVGTLHNLPQQYLLHKHETIPVNHMQIMSAAA